jgi:hypothetical protein
VEVGGWASKGRQKAPVFVRLSINFTLEIPYLSAITLKGAAAIVDSRTGARAGRWCTMIVFFFNDFF